MDTCTILSFICSIGLFIVGLDVYVTEKCLERLELSPQSSTDGVWMRHCMSCQLQSELSGNSYLHYTCCGNSLKELLISELKYEEH